jgi:two-component system, cell cycle sensor histidine kinase and response regulator CckA
MGAALTGAVAGVETEGQGRRGWPLRVYFAVPVAVFLLAAAAGVAYLGVQGARTAALIVGAGFLLGLAAALLVYRDVARPLQRFDAAVRDALPVPEEGPREVRVLAAHVNALLDSVSRELHARHELEEGYRALFERHPGPMWVYDLETLRFLAANAAAVEKYGYTEDEFLGMTIMDIRPVEDREPLREVLSSAEQHGSRRRVWRHLRKDGGQLDVVVLAADIDFGGRAARLIFAQDVTDRRHLEEQLRQAQKMEAVGSLAGGIAHDFNNMLTVVRASAAMLLRRLDDPSLREDVERIDAAGARGAELTKQLLAFSRRQVLRPEVTDVNAVIDEARSLLDRLIGEDVEIVYELGRTVGPVVVDRGQLAQVVVNLAVNARDAMPRGGRLTIGTSEVELDDAYVTEHVGVAPGPHVVLRMTDTGVGMNEETQKRAFDPFFTTKSEGTGLGLATVYGIVNQSNAHIWLYSEPGLGTTFKLYFPRVSAPVAPASAAPEVTSLRGQETVLLVEDDPAVRPLVAMTLRSYGYTVIEAATPAEALAAAHDGERIDLLLTDIVMPEMNGRELAEQLVELRRGLKVVFTSGYPADSTIRVGIAADTAAYIEKPFLPDELARKLRELLDA